MCDAEPQRVRSQGTLREDRGTSHGCQWEAFGHVRPGQSRTRRHSPRTVGPRRRRPAPCPTLRSLTAECDAGDPSALLDARHPYDRRMDWLVPNDVVPRGRSVRPLCRIPRTADGHHRVPPCAVGIPSASRLAAIWRRVRPAERSSRMRFAISVGTPDLRPRVARSSRGPATRRRSTASRSSSSTGISLVPHGSSIVSMYGSKRRKVVRLMPSASAAWLRV
jgi:hypothetical protein